MGVKHKPDGTIDGYKASIIAKGYNQLMVVDYYESFSLVAKLITVRVFLDIGTSYNGPIY